MKKMTFIISKSPYISDINYQLMRMALSVAMDVELKIVYRGDAALLGSTFTKNAARKDDFASQEKYLVEMEVPTYVVKEDMETRRIRGEDLKKHVTIITEKKIRDFIGQSDIVFNA